MPLYLQLALPCGYLGYLLARIGLNHKDNATTMLFLTLVFSLSSVLAGSVSPESIRYFAIVLTPIFLGIAWRKCLNRWIMQILHWFRICNSTAFPDLWLEITQNEKVALHQVTVFLKNGQALMCGNLYDFENAPIDLFRTDTEGNVGLYVTHERSTPKGRFFRTKDAPIETVNGPPEKYYRLTYVPKSEIERIEFTIFSPISS